MTVRRLTKAKGNKLDAVVTKILQKELQLMAKEITKDFDAKIEGVKTEFGQALGNIAESAINGKLDARTVATNVARAFQPQLSDFFNKSFSQVGDDFFKFLSKAQRNM